MADPGAPLPGNSDGIFFVADSCIDCDLCRQIAPETFVAAAGQSVVGEQPDGDLPSLRAAMALVACPTGSIGTRAKVDLKAAIRSYPEEIEDGVYFCGFASRHSYGASSYLIVHPEGNILVDSPRFSRALAQRLEELGGVSKMFLTHSDDVADHERFRDRFGCERIIHSGERLRGSVEHAWDGSEAMVLGQGLTAIPTPGHTRGHAVLHYNDQFLFTGDHLAWSERYAHLIAFRQHNWYSWPKTIESMAGLAQYRFEWVLPGHGRRAYFPAEVMSERLAECVEWMKRVA